MISISRVQLGQEVEEEVLQVLRSGMIAQGPKVRELEESFEKYLNVKHVVAVNNGTTALIAALKALDLPAGSEVITTPFTFVATLNAILEVGLRPRFADIDPDTFNLTAASVEPLINGNTSAVMPVHLYGQCADIDAISALCLSRGLKLVEDAAQAHGATSNGKYAGSFGVGCFSLYATKNITTGEGGLISTNDDVVADTLRILRNQGMRARYQYEMPGNNFRLTDLQAAVGLPQIRSIEKIISAREHNALQLNEILGENSNIQTPHVSTGNRHVWHQYTIRLSDKLSSSRDAIVNQINENGVGAGVYYPRLVHDYGCYQNHELITVDQTPVAQAVADSVISLPVHQFLSSDEVTRVAEVVNKVVTGY